MQIAVCDDNELDRELVVDLLYIFFENKSISYSIDHYSSAENMLYEIADNHRYDVIFLDMYMDGILGIEAARKLREMNYNGEIIFLTATQDFALDGYEVGAKGYLLKSDGFEKIHMVMERILKRYGVDVYQIQRRNSMHQIPYNDILYIESDNTRCIFHTRTEEKYSVYKKLSEIEKELNDARFLRTHQSYLVNMNQIINVNNDEFELVNYETVPIRRRGGCEVRRAYFSYIENSKIRHERVLQKI